MDLGLGGRQQPGPPVRAAEAATGPPVRAADADPRQPAASTRAGGSPLCSNEASAAARWASPT